MSSELASVGVVGLGVMGAPMTVNLLRSNPDRAVSMWARRPASLEPLVVAGGRSVETCRGLAESSDVVLVVLPDLPQLIELLDGEDGLLAGVQEPTVLIVCSTVAPTGLRELADRVGTATDGLLRVVDAPISGGQDGAEAATLSIMVGGDEADVAVALPVLETMGTPVHLGPLGSGQVAKACNQLVVAATIQALGECAVIAERSGLDLAVLMDVLGGGYAGSRILATRGQRLVEHDHTPSGAARYMVKDLDSALAAADATRTGTRLLPALRASFAELVEAGFGDDDIAVTQAFVEGLPPRQ
ncbi:MAG: NAD(P)-dependent oxidoreductase [Mycobacteriaceae bacterium]